MTSKSSNKRGSPVQSITPEFEAKIRHNVFHAAHGVVHDWAKFKWRPDADLPHSSQAFCVSVWGTFLSSAGKVVRELVSRLLNDSAFTDAVQRYSSNIPAQFESDS